MQVDLVGAMAGGRSGAAIYAIRGADEAKYVMRVTSARRAHRESYAVQRIPSAHALWVDGTGVRIVMTPKIQRAFPVAMTIARHMTGDPAEGADLEGAACMQFSSLFESTSVRKHAKCPESVIRLLSWLVAHWPDGDRRARAALMRAAGQNWQSVVGHGDPSYKNLIWTDRGLAPIDFAGGGVLPVRTHRARWVNTVHWRNGKQGQCCYCIDAEKDHMALLIDACRRLRSDAGDGAREGIWRGRVDALLGEL